MSLTDSRRFNYNSNNVGIKSEHVVEILRTNDKSEQNSQEIQGLKKSLEEANDTIQELQYEIDDQIQKRNYCIAGTLCCCCVSILGGTFGLLAWFNVIEFNGYMNRLHYKVIGLVFSLLSIGCGNQSTYEGNTNENDPLIFENTNKLKTKQRPKWITVGEFKQIAQHGDVKKMEKTLQNFRGAKIEQRAFNEALNLASKNRHQPMVNLLLKYDKAVTESLENAWRDPLEMAAIENNPSLIQSLLTHKDYEQTHILKAMKLAVKKGNTLAVKSLIEFGGRKKNELTEYIVQKGFLDAVNNNFPVVVKVFLEKASISGFTYCMGLEKAVESNEKPMLELLVNNINNPSIKGLKWHHLYNVMVKTIKQKDKPLFEKLIEKSKNLEESQTSNLLSQVLSVAVKQMNISFVKLILEKASDTSISSSTLSGPLKEAVNRENEEIVSLILTYGKKVLYASAKRAALKIAQQKRNKKIEKLIKKHIRFWE